MVNSLRLAPIHDDDDIVTHVIGIQLFSEAKIDLQSVSYPVFKEKCLYQHDHPDRHSPTSRKSPPDGLHQDICGLLQLSDEVLAHNILSWVTPRDVASIGSVCRRMRQLTKNEHVRKVVCQNAWGREVIGMLEISLDASISPIFMTC